MLPRKSIHHEPTSANVIPSCKPIAPQPQLNTHGFAILDELRSHFPAVQFLLMDRATTLSARALWPKEAIPLKWDLPRLTPDEEALYKDMRGKRLGKNLRLEQERIPFKQVAMALNWLPGMENAFPL